MIIMKRKAFRLLLSFVLFTLFCKAQQGDWEPINKEDSCNVRAWQQLEEGSKAVRQQEHPHRRQDGAKGDLHNRPIRIPQDSGDCAHQSRLAGT